MPVTITCYGGVREIGGSKILLEDGAGRQGASHQNGGGHAGTSREGAGTRDTAGRRILFDFGQSFDRHKVFFDGVLLRERASRGLLDPIALGLIPPLRGLLREDVIPVFNGAHLTVREIPPTGRQKTPKQEVEISPEAVEEFWEHWRSRCPEQYRDLRRESGPVVDFLFLSHAHLDHIGDVQYVAPDVPAYSTRVTAAISKVIMDVGPAGKSGAVYVNPCKSSAEGILQADREQPLVPRPWGMVDGGFGGDALDGEPSALDSSDGDKSAAAPSGDRLDSAACFWDTPPSKSEKGLAPRAPAPPPGSWLKHWNVDHSLMGAAAYAVETDAGWVAYTGDLRFHGGKSETSHKFAAELAKLHPVALLCEGTRLPYKQANVTEEEACQNCLKAVRQAQGKLVVADFAARNVERLLSFMTIAAETRRTLLLQPRDAYLLRAVLLADSGAIPDVMEEACVGLYADPKGSQSDWEKNVVRRYSSCRVGPNEVQGSPGDFILAFSLMDMADMLDIQFLIGDGMSGVYIFSNSPAFDDEYAIDLKRLMNWTRHLNLEMIGLKLEGEDVEAVRGYHSSGHASRQELVDFVKQVKPKMLIPIHTEEPEEWVGELAGTGIKICQPEVGKEIDVPA